MSYMKPSSDLISCSPVAIADLCSPLPARNGSHEGDEGNEGHEGHEGDEEVYEEGRWRRCGAGNEGDEGHEGNEGHEVSRDSRRGLLEAML